MQNKICYIAGPITGYENFNHHNFNMNAKFLEEDGFQVFNPATLPSGLTEQQYMAICLPMVMASGYIYVLSGYKESKGAMAELALAEKLGLQVIYDQPEI